MDVNSVLALALLVSLCVNILKAIKRPPPMAPRAQSQELQEFLADLAAGAGVVQITRIDPQNILLRSPKRRG